MRVAYHPLDEKSFYDRLKYDNGILSSGNGLGDITIFRRQRLHRGSGAFTNIILKYGRRILPYLQKYLWPASKQFGKNVASDMILGNASLKQSLRKHGKQSLADIGKKVMGGASSS